MQIPSDEVVQEPSEEAVQEPSQVPREEAVQVPSQLHREQELQEHSDNEEQFPRDINASGRQVTQVVTDTAVANVGDQRMERQRTVKTVKTDDGKTVIKIFGGSHTFNFN